MQGSHVHSRLAKMLACGKESRLVGVQASVVSGGTRSDGGEGAGTMGEAVHDLGSPLGAGDEVLIFGALSGG